MFNPVVRLKWWTIRHCNREVVDSWRHKTMMTLIILLFKWPHLSLIGMDHLTSLSMQNRVRKSIKAQISSNWSQTTQPEQRKKGRQAVGGWCLTSPPLPPWAAFHQVLLSALLCPTLSSYPPRPKITDEKIAPQRSDFVVVLVPGPSLVLQLPAEKSLLLLPRETAPFTGTSPRDFDGKEC